MSFSNLSTRFCILSLAVIEAVCITVRPTTPDGTSRVNFHDGLTYQWIPPGSYYTGCLPGDVDCYGVERHREKITVGRGFWIGRTEVTQSAYMRVMHADPSRYKGAERPVDTVGWNDASTYCSRIGMRLPTESEWEWAAYGGTPELPKQPLGAYAWYDANGNDSTHPVATKVANGYGLWDMLGNVWEWVQDPYNEKIFADPVPLKKGKEHVLKGASFYGDVKNATYMTHAAGPASKYDVGFRIVMEVK